LPVITQYASTATTVTGTWATTANATGSTAGTYATWTSTTANATASLDLSGYDFSAIPDGSTINSVTVSWRHNVSTTTPMNPSQSQAYVGATTIGTLQTGTESTTLTTNTYTIPATLEQLKNSGFKIRFTGRRVNSTTSGIARLDWTSVAVDYTEPAPKAKLATAALTTWTGQSLFTLPAASHVVVDGKLNITTAAAYPTTITTAAYDLTESYFYADMGAIPSRTSYNFEIYLSVYIGGTTDANSASVMWTADKITARRMVGGTAQDSTELTYNPVAHRYFRIRHSGATLYWETSPDAQTWTVLRSEATPWGGVINTVYGVFRSGNWGGATPEVTAQVGAVNTVPAAKAETLSFTSWATGSTNYNGLNATNRVTGDNLSIDVSNTYPWVNTAAQYDLTGSHYGTTFVSTPNVGAGTTEMIVGVEASLGNTITIGWTNNVIYARRTVAGTADSAGWLGYNPATHKYLRVREAAGTVYWEYSPDGTAWTNIRTPEATPFSLTAVRPIHMAGHYNAETVPGTAVYGAVNTYAAPPPPLTWGPNTTIDFGAATQNGPSSAAERTEVTTLAGEAPKYELWYANWNTTWLSTANLTAVHNAGRINYITWEAWDASQAATYSYANILAGNHNTYIDSVANIIKAFGHPVYLRPFHEMNGNWYPWCVGVNSNTAQGHKDAWNYVRNRFAALGVSNVFWVWSPNTNFGGSPALSTLYPGDSVVDIVAIDGYNFGPAAGDDRPWLSPGQVFDPTYADLRAIGITRPYWIGETSSGEAGGDKAAWVLDYFKWMTNQPDLDAFVWFHLNKERDWRINSSQGSADSFLAGMAQLTTNPAGPDQSVQPWSTVTLTGTGTGTWTQTSGTTVTLGGTGATRTFTAPAAMTAQALVFSYGGDTVTVNVARSRHGIRQSDGTVKAVRFKINLPNQLPQYQQATVSVDPSVRSYQYTTVNAVSPAATTLRAPSRIIEGDLLLMMIMVDSGTLAAAGTLHSTNGFTEIDRRASTQVRTAWAYRIATAADVGRATFPIGGLTTSADGCAIILAVRDWSGTYSQTTFAITTATNADWVTPAVTPQTDRSLLMTFVSNNGNNGGKAWGFIPPVGAGAAGYTENAGGWNSGAVSSEIITGTTSSGTRTWTVNTNSTATLKMNAAISIPAGTATKTVTQMLNEFSATGGSGGPLTNRTNVAFEDSTGLSSTYHIFAEGLDWSKKVGLLIYTDGSGESGLTPEAITTLDPYVLYGNVGLIAVAKKHNMVLLTPRAPGDGCMDGDGVCWYDHSQNGVSPWQKLEWSNELIRKVLTEYNIDRRRIAIGGYSSGAQWTMSWWGPRYASEIMLDGIALGISYGGQPRVNPNLTTAYKANVDHIWNTGDADTSYTRPNWWDGVQTGRQWYIDNGFAVTELQLIPGLGHDRYDIVDGRGVGHFGVIYDTEITARIIPS
jgi:beta-mannanase